MSGLPNGDDDTDLDEAANEAAEKEMAEAIVADASDTVVQVDGDVSLDDDGAPEEEEPRPSRKQRRANRYREQEERANAAERERDELRERLDRLESSHREQVQGFARRVAESGPGPSSHEDSLAGVYKKQEELLSDYNSLLKSGQMTPDVERRYQDRYREIEREKLEAVAREQIQRMQPQIENDAQVRAIRERNRDVFGDHRASAWAKGRYEQMVADGEPASEATIEKAIDESRRRFRLGGYKEPTQRDRSRYTGSSPGPAGSSGRSFALTPQLKEWADETYPHIPESKRYQHWFNEVGKKMLDK